MTSLMFVLLMQYVVSTKAGLVNYVQGPSNVKVTESVPVGAPIRTGPDGFAEVLLNPGSFLRLGANSEAILESITLVDVAVRVVSGAAVIEAVGFTKENPLRVTSGDLRMRIIKDGVYVVEDGQVKVAEGQLQIDGGKTTYKKGWVVSKTGALKFSKTNLLAVEMWSRNRSSLIGAANANAMTTLRGNPSLRSSNFDIWLWDPSFGAYTYMPYRRYRSPYGYNYRSVAEFYSVNSGGSTARGGSDAGGNSNSNSGFGGAGGGGGAGSSSGGFAASDPPPAARESFGSKSGAGERPVTEAAP